MSLEILIEAINKRKTIKYEYNKIDEPVGERIGHPYAIYIFTSKAGIMSTKIHIVQIDGVSKSIEKNPFPSFRTHNIEELTNVQILDDIPSFEEPFHIDYKPESKLYLDVIAKL